MSEKSRGSTDHVEPEAVSAPPPEPAPAREVGPGEATGSVRETSRVMRLLVLVVAAVTLAGTAVGYTVYASQRSDRHRATGAQPSAAAGAVDLAAHGRLLFRNSVLGPNYGHLASVPTADPSGPRTYSDVECERVYAVNGKAICLTADRGAITTYYAVVLDANLRQVRRVKISGLPSRARLSADGRLATWTVFVYGDSYAGGGFSTRTSILDTSSGKLTATLEKFTVIRNGRHYQSADVNFWGVTFARDDNLFYATMATQNTTYLVAGDLRARTVRTIHENVECPSLSPDQKRIAYKKKVSSDAGHPWRLHVLDLATGRDVELAEPTSVDDQAAWLDDNTVMYSRGSTGPATDVWAVPADGSGSPRRIVTGGFSPASLS